MKSIIVLYSHHHNNTRKVAKAIASIIGAVIVSPQDIEKPSLSEYDLIGFGSGIDTGKHYKELLDFANGLTLVEKKKCFIFSTSAMQGKSKVANDHSILRGILSKKGYKIIGEYSCKGYNTNSFLKYLGGINKSRPNEEDIQNAKQFAEKLIERLM